MFDIEKPAGSSLVFGRERNPFDDVTEVEPLCVEPHDVRGQSVDGQRIEHRHQAHNRRDRSVRDDFAHGQKRHRLARRAGHFEPAQHHAQIERIGSDLLNRHLAAEFARRDRLDAPAGDLRYREIADDAKQQDSADGAWMLRSAASVASG